MKGIVVKRGEDPNEGEILGAKLGDLILPILPREAAIRRLEPGNPIVFSTTIEGG